MDAGQERVVALVDMDCFYVQVEQRRNPALRNKPCVVAQYKTWRGGGIIAVSYEARARGVSRNMFADDAVKLCPDLQVARVPELHGKADLTHYREASVEVISVLSRFAVIERASIDEAYLDLTRCVEERLSHGAGAGITGQQLKSTHVQGFPQDPSGREAPPDKVAVSMGLGPRFISVANANASMAATGTRDGNTSLVSHLLVLLPESLRASGVEQWLDSLSSCSSAALRLTVAAVVVEEMRAAVEEHTGFQCSAGISHNKVLAKLACGLNKPNRQTLLPLVSVPQLFSTLPIRKIRNLGGKLGASISETLNVENMGDLTRFSRKQLEQHFGEKTGTWLFDLCRGIEFEPVKPRQLPQSIGCSKNFPGKTCLASTQQVQHWLHQLALELEERLRKDRDMNARVARQLTVGVRQAGALRSISRCCSLPRYEALKICSDAFSLIRSLNSAGAQPQAWSPALTLLHLSAGKFSELSSSGGITSFLSGDAVSSQSPLTSTPAPRSRCSRSGRSSGAIQSLFERAAEKRKRQTEETRGEEENTDGRAAVLHRSLEMKPMSDEGVKELGEEKTDFTKLSLHFEEGNKTFISSGGSSFFKRKSLERNLKKPLSEEEKSEDWEAAKSDLVGRFGAELRDCEDSELAGGSSFFHSKTLERDGSRKGLQHEAVRDVSEVKKETGVSSEDIVVCERCRLQVSVWEMPEHNDFHFAQDLQKSFSSASRTLLSGGASNPLGGTPKAKRARVQKSTTGTLDAFFKRS
ncbi:hypothetical protein DNTS_010086 [Danionella cerebrum]|uniref:DNA polymerase eta n=1 Tax=Danionella cerebrum TaxID=2873325 RepID=A0A553N3Q1_9TELE|nr:hypothetical protein DNTS_010086 [Danionella translucida]